MDVVTDTVLELGLSEQMDFNDWGAYQDSQFEALLGSIRHKRRQLEKRKEKAEKEERLAAEAEEEAARVATANEAAGVSKDAGEVDDDEPSGDDGGVFEDPEDNCNGED